jgi:hypothetical protein
LGRHGESRKIREDAAKIAFEHKHATKHEYNGEQDDYKDLDGNRNFIANFTKGFAHHPPDDRDAGEVIVKEYKTLLDALKSGKPSDFENMKLGLGRVLTNPQCGLAFDLEGPDCGDIGDKFIGPAPRIDSAEAAGEMAELYWMALCRDVKFLEFGSDPTGTVDAAVADLSSSRYSEFPKSFNGKPKIVINTDTIFRGVTDGDMTGPYISQFLYKDIPWGVQNLKQVQLILEQKDYLTTYQDWLDAQNGKGYGPDHDAIQMPKKSRHIITPRDLAYYVHHDALYQAYLGACVILLNTKKSDDPNSPDFKIGFKFDALLPYESPNPNSKTQSGFGTFGGPHILSLVTEVATRALKAQWFQKWFVHRRLRPEAFGGLIHRQKNSTSPSPTPGLTAPNPSYDKIINREILDSEVLPKIFQHNATSNSPNPGSYLLPQAFPEGSPTHPSYGAGHATVAGACTTILKAFFEEDQLIKDIFDPVMPISDGTDLTTSGVQDADKLTAGGELNKLAANIAIGRNWGGVHYRSDYSESLKVGEELAIGILQEQALTYNEKFACRLTKFDGTKITFKNDEIT